MRGRLLPIAESAVLAVALSCVSGCGHEARSGPDGARQGNEATSKASRLGYVALGDSFTIGTGTDPSSAFPARLVALQEARGCRFQLQNLAKNGFITDEVIARQLPETNVDGLRLVTFSTGANELVRGIGEDEYRASLRRLFALLHERFEARSSPRVRIVVVPQPDWSKAPAARSFGDPAALSRDISRRNEVLREEARKAGADYVDYSALARDLYANANVAPDGLHPSEEAHAAWARAIDLELGSLCDATTSARP
jgi:lysophospholipase L1-like esterase